MEQANTPLERAAAVAFVDRWLWASPERKSVSEEWSWTKKVDVVRMLLDFAESQRRAVKTVRDEAARPLTSRFHQNCKTCTCVEKSI